MIAANDGDPEETREWIDALHAVIERQGPERARFLLDRLAELALRSPLHWLGSADQSLCQQHRAA